MDFPDSPDIYKKHRGRRRTVTYCLYRNEMHVYIDGSELVGPMKCWVLSELKLLPVREVTAF